MDHHLQVEVRSHLEWVVMVRLLQHPICPLHLVVEEEEVTVAGVVDLMIEVDGEVHRLQVAVDDEIQVVVVGSVVLVTIVALHLVHMIVALQEVVGEVMIEEVVVVAVEDDEVEEVMGPAEGAMATGAGDKPNLTQHDANDKSVFRHLKNDSYSDLYTSSMQCE